MKPRQAAAPPNLAMWRKGMRAELIARRQAASPEQHQAWSLAISLHLLRAVPWREGITVGFCWPYKAEYDARPLLQSLRERGMKCALPVVQGPGQTMTFRHWAPGVEMAEGPLGIVYPVGTAHVDPQIVLIPLVGFGRIGDRLGYGGGYFDRTIAAWEPRPLCIGVGFELSQLETTFPQPHDVAMDAIITEAGARFLQDGNMTLLAPALVRDKLAELALERTQEARFKAHTVPHSFP